MSQLPPAASGVRQQWADIPEAHRHAIEDTIGQSVIRTESQSGGFSPGVASRLFTADGAVYFLKAIGQDINQGSVQFYLREAQFMQHLPPDVPSPRLLHHVDDVENTGWTWLLFENIDGHNPNTPWDETELQRVVQAIIDFSQQLTPSPITAGITTAPDTIRSALERRGWEMIQQDPDKIVLLDDWTQAHLEQLINLQHQAPQAAAGDTLVHFDVRADNLLITPDKVWFVDWAHPIIGAAWLDLLFFLPSAIMQGAQYPESLLAQHPGYGTTSPEAINACLAWVAGMLLHVSMLPAPPGLPTLRPFQRGQAEAALSWLKQRIIERE